MPKAAKKSMSNAHKDALAQGRNEARAVRAYLAALENPTSADDREKIERRLAQAQQAIEEAPDPVKRLEAIQRRIDLEDQLAAAGDGVADMDALEQAFVASAASYSERKAITYSAWRELGVPASVLREAGVPRTRRTKPAAA